MGKHGSARAVLVVAAIIALGGCTGVGTATAPDVPGQGVGSTSTAATSPASSAAEGSGRQSATSTASARQRGTSQSFVQADSIPFPVAVGNTWVYRTTVGDQTGRTTNRIVSAGPVAAGYEVTMSSTTDVAGTATAPSPFTSFTRTGRSATRCPRSTACR